MCGCCTVASVLAPKGDRSALWVGLVLSKVNRVLWGKPHKDLVGSVALPECVVFRNVFFLFIFNFHFIIFIFLILSLNCDMTWNVFYTVLNISNNISQCIMWNFSFCKYVLMRKFSNVFHLENT